MIVFGGSDAGVFTMYGLYGGGRGMCVYTVFSVVAAYLSCSIFFPTN